MTAPANALRAYRADHKVTLKQLAHVFGVNKTTVLRWEEGQVPAERVLTVSRETGIPPSDLRPDLYPSERAAS
jgi:transcriptional regulator with XRE-family HTH domain